MPIVYAVLVIASLLLGGTYMTLHQQENITPQKVRVIELTPQVTSTPFVTSKVIQQKVIHNPTTNNNDPTPNIVNCRYEHLGIIKQSPEDCKRLGECPIGNGHYTLTATQAECNALQMPQNQVRPTDFIIPTSRPTIDINTIPYDCYVGPYVYRLNHNECINKQNDYWSQQQNQQPTLIPYEPWNPPRIGIPSPTPCVNANGGCIR